MDGQEPYRPAGVAGAQDLSPSLAESVHSLNSAICQQIVKAKLCISIQ